MSMTLINTNVVASRLIKREKALLPVAVRCSKTPLNFVCGNENFPGETEFVFGIFCIEYLSRRSEKVDGHFAKCRFSFRFAPFRFVNYCKPKLTQTLDRKKLDRRNICSPSNVLPMQLKVSCCCLMICRAQLRFKNITRYNCLKGRL